MRKLIKLINNERANITLLSKKAYYDKCAADAFDLCGTIDNAVCTLYAYDYCIKEDYAACSKGQMTLAISIMTLATVLVQKTTINLLLNPGTYRSSNDLNIIV